MAETIWRDLSLSGKICFCILGFCAELLEFKITFPWRKSCLFNEFKQCYVAVKFPYGSTITDSILRYDMTVIGKNDKWHKIRMWHTMRTYNNLSVRTVSYNFWVIYYIWISSFCYCYCGINKIWTKICITGECTDISFCYSYAGINKCRQKYIGGGKVLLRFEIEFPE